jgi:hypothetical protein
MDFAFMAREIIGNHIKIESPNTAHGTKKRARHLVQVVAEALRG